MEHNVCVNITKVDGKEEEVEVYIELNDFYECSDLDEKIDFIKEQTKKQYKDIEDIDFEEYHLNDLESEIDDINDTSDWHPNENFEDFMEHENF